MGTRHTALVCAILILCLLALLGAEAFPPVFGGLSVACATMMLCPPALVGKAIVRPPSHAGHPLEQVAIRMLVPYQRNARTHSKKQIRAIARSIERFGFTNPVLITGDNMILAGHGRVEAARLLGMMTVPVIRIEHLSEADIRAYILADNKLAERAGWDRDMLAGELR